MRIAVSGPPMNALVTATMPQVAYTTDSERISPNKCSAPVPARAPKSTPMSSEGPNSPPENPKPMHRAVARIFATSSTSSEPADSSCPARAARTV